MLSVSRISLLSEDCTDACLNSLDEYRIRFLYERGEYLPVHPDSLRIPPTTDGYHESGRDACQGWQVYPKLEFHYGELRPEHLHGSHHHAHTDGNGLESPDASQDQNRCCDCYEHGLDVSLHECIHGIQMLILCTAPLSLQLVD
jgi:hypothetical protein